jgi:hypothetical protein
MLRCHAGGRSVVVPVLRGLQPRGWCVADSTVYNKLGAESAYGDEVALYKKVPHWNKLGAA